ncbi:MAG: diguanylate cyclase domain-containing protein [Pseudomonas sp.]|uniref:diguanylate cyclase domain-containing protein n=1 Tax=Pseudomonas sp. TaxID=306 RepID=UPI003D138A21
MHAQRLCQRLILWFLLSLTVLALPAQALEQPVDVATVAAAPLSLTTHVALLEDPQRNLTLNDVQSPELAARFKGDQPPGSALGLGFTRSAYWLRLTLRNSSDAPLQRMLVVENPRISHIQAYLPDAIGTYRTIVTGCDTPASTRVYPNRNFVFPLTLAAQSEQVLYLRMESSVGLLIPLQLWEPAAFHAYERDDYVGKAWYFGIAAAMILFNLMLFVALRDRVYLLYVLFAVCISTTLAIKNGLAPEFIWGGIYLDSNVAYYSGVSLSLAAMLLFMRRMLQTDRLLPRVDRLLLGLVVLYLLTPVIYALALPVFGRLAILLNLATALLIIGVGLACAYKGQRSAYFFLGAFALLMLGGAMTTLRAMGVMPTNVFTVDGIQLGSALEMILLAFALADRYNVMRRDKARVQEELLQAQQALVDSLKNSERELEQRVAQRTDELQLLNRKLETLSLTDALSGIANRRHFDHALAQEWSRAQRLGHSLALGIMDVDWFKHYNDHYGHQAGDVCLQRIAHTLSTTLGRSSDLVARYGGEEFVFLAPMTDDIGAQEMARKVVLAVQGLAMPHAASPIGHVTLSIGVAALIPEQDDLPENLMQRADAALYQAKKQGRNRVAQG